MGAQTLVNGHVFDFGTGTCVKCGMDENEYEKLGEPICSGKRPKPDGAETHVQCERRFTGE